jgi:GntP family gluconate:H+ symporter
MLVGYAWARHAGKNENTTAYTDNVEETSLRQSFSPLKAFLPVAVPILLIAAKSFFAMEPGKTAPWLAHLLVLGDPVLALSVGTLLAFACKSRWNRTEISQLLATGVEKAANVIVIIGAGGAFGAILAAANLGSHFNSVDGFGNLGLFMPFLLTFILKTAQGSSTVAIITAASIIQPLLPAIGLTSDSDKLLAVLAMGAGSMTISHANDAYFWVISKFSGMSVKTTMKIYTTATVFMSVSSLLMIYLLRIFLSR